MSYSGQEVVSQEECKLILAKFFEGVDCYNSVDKTIKFTVQDPDIRYDEETKSIHTRYFSCRPLEKPDKLAITFEAKLPEGTTGLEVIMHTDTYEKIRIMPLIYLPTCNPYSYPGGVDTFPGLQRVCLTTDTVVEVKIIGDILSFNSTEIVVVGEGGNGEPVTLKFFDAADIALTFTLVITKNIEDVVKYIYNEETEDYEETIVAVEVITLEATTLQPIVTFDVSGGYTFNIAIFSCDFGFTGNVKEACNSTEPVGTKVTLSSVETITIDESTGVVSIDSGATKFKLLPTTELISGANTADLFFSLATQIQYIKPYEFTTDLYVCSDDPGWGFNFFMAYFFMYWSESSKAWYMDITISGAYRVGSDGFLYDESQDNDIVHSFYNGKAARINLNSGIKETTEDGMVITRIPVGWCNGYHLTDAWNSEPIPNNSYRVFTDPRVVWNETFCKPEITCESSGIYLPDCMTCQEVVLGPNSERGIIIDVVNVDDDELCTCDGTKDKNEVISGCLNPRYQPFGSYPYVEPEAGEVIKTAEVIYFRGTSMYMLLESALLTYELFIGDLTEDTEVNSIHDDASNETYTPNLASYILLVILKVPFEYVELNGSLALNFFYDKEFENLAEDEQSIFPPFIDTGAAYDFGVPLDFLKSNLPYAWANRLYDWGTGCGWVHTETTYTSKTGNLPLTFSLSNIDDLDIFTCDVERRTVQRTSNVPILHGVPAESIAPGLTVDFAKYTKDIAFLVSKEAETFAYYTNKYSMDTKP